MTDLIKLLSDPNSYIGLGVLLLLVDTVRQRKKNGGLHERVAEIDERVKKKLREQTEREEHEETRRKLSDLINQFGTRFERVEQEIRELREHIDSSISYLTEKVEELESRLTHTEEV
jgi:vacuolar-type H+-ATPase subunit I/STV1